jgi:hypothetical protein
VRGAITLSMSSRLLQIVRSEYIFCIMVGCIITVGRVPTWLNEQTNVDEAQWLAGCVTLDAEYGFWRVDGTTSGPLVIHFLWAWNRLWGVNSFLTAKLLTTTVWVCVSILGYLSIRTFSDKVVARAVVLPAVFSIAAFLPGDFVGYNGEQLPILLLAIAAFLLCKISESARSRSRAMASILGLVLGILPYSKLQAIPMGFLFGLLGIWILRRNRAVVDLLIVTAISGGAPLVWLATNHQLRDFWVSYILENLQYASSHSALPVIKRFYAFPLVWFTIKDARALVVCSLFSIALLGTVSLWRSRALLTHYNNVLAGSILYLAVAGYCVAQPGTFFEHYYLFMLHPLLLVVAAFLQTSIHGLTIRSQRLWAGLWMSVTLTGVFVSQAGLSDDQGSGYRWPGLRRPEAHSVAKVIMQHADGQSRLAIWGWACHLHVQTGIPQATLEGHSFRQIMQGPYQDYFLARFLRQLELHKEKLLFVDATDSGESKYFKDSAYRHQNYSEIDAFVKEHLELVTIENGCRIYRSRRF